MKSHARRNITRASIRASSGGMPTFSNLVVVARMVSAIDGKEIVVSIGRSGLYFSCLLDLE